MDQQARNELSALYERDKRLDPHKVVDAARPKTSPLHRFFDWNNTKAAEAWRIHQARQLIRVAVTMIPAVSNGTVREFVSVSNLRRSGGGSYLATVDVLSDEQRHDQALADAVGTLMRLEERFRYLAELQPVWDALAEALAALSKAA